MAATQQNKSNDLVQIEIDPKKLEQLFSNGTLCAAEIRCLNFKSKKSIWNLCLASCAKMIADDTASYPHCQALIKSKK